MVDYETNLIKPVCVVAFAADSQKQFQFGTILRKLGMSFVLFRDSETKWYQHGVMGLGGRPAVASYIRNLRQCYRVKTIGASSGAYAALLYGQLAVVDEIIVISPVTGKEVEGLDPKWHSFILPGPEGDPSPIDDLRQFFPNGPCCPTTAYVTDAEDSEIDRWMAERIGIKNIVVLSGYTHSTLARGMRDSGLLHSVLRS